MCRSWPSRSARRTASTPVRRIGVSRRTSTRARTTSSSGSTCRRTGTGRRSWSGRSPRTARRNTARATLLDIWEIDRKVEVSNNGGGVQISNELIAKDQPPAVTIAPVGAGARRHAGRDHRLRRPTMGFPARAEAAHAASARAVAARRAAVAGQRAAAAAAASAADAVRAVDGLSRAGRRRRSIPRATSRSRTARLEVKATFSAARHLHAARLRPRRSAPHARRRDRHRRRPEFKPVDTTTINAELANTQTVQNLRILRFLRLTS